MKNRLVRYLLAAALTLSSSCAWAQAATDIYLLDLAALDQSKTVILRITDVPGYDNQPHYSADGNTIYFTRISSGRANVMAYDIATASTRVILADLESDYSPTLMPRVNALSVIRVEADQRQRLWKIPLDGSPAQVIFENIEGVGYHAWAGPRIALMFILGEPPTLKLAGPAGIALPIAQNIGRAVVAIAGSTEVAYVSKDTANQRWTINAYDYAIDRNRIIAPTLVGQEDFAISPNGTLWMAEGSVLYRWSSERPAWAPLIDLSTIPTGTISRMTLSPDGQQLALVAEELEQ